MDSNCVATGKVDEIGERHKEYHPPLNYRPTPPAPTGAPAPALTVRVLVAGVYNGPGHKALPWAEVGEVIAVAGGPYAQSLLAGGYVLAEGQGYVLAEGQGLVEPYREGAEKPPSAAPPAKRSRKKE